MPEVEFCFVSKERCHVLVWYNFVVVGMVVVDVDVVLAATVFSVSVNPVVAMFFS